jgi:hypothetical protein
MQARSFSSLRGRHGHYSQGRQPYDAHIVTWSRSSTTFNGGSVNEKLPLMFPRAPQSSSRMPDGAAFNPYLLHSSRNQSNGSTEFFIRGVALDARLTRSFHIAQMRKRTAQRMGMLGNLPNWTSDICIRNGVLIYNQRIRPMMDYACLAWRSAERSHVRRLQVLKATYLRLATVPPGT